MTPDQKASINEAGLVERLRERADSYRQSGPSAEHTAVMLDEAAACIQQLEGEVAKAQHALRWVDQVYPSNSSGGAWVSMTWDEFDAMRAVIGKGPLKSRASPRKGDVVKNINLALRNRAEAAESRLSALLEEVPTAPGPHAEPAHAPRLHE